MKSLIKKSKKEKVNAKVQQAQCCAKTSSSPAGCHD